MTGLAPIARVRVGRIGHARNASQNSPKCTDTGAQPRNEHQRAVAA